MSPIRRHALWYPGVPSTPLPHATSAFNDVISRLGYWILSPPGVIRTRADILQPMSP